MSRVGGAVQRIEKRTEERVEKAAEQVAGEASATLTANIDASNERAERIIAATAKLEARQLWSAAAAMCLALLPVVVVVAGLWMGIAGLITGAQWALDVGRERVARDRALARRRRGPGRGRLRALRVPPLGCRSGGSLEGLWGAEVATQEEVTTRVDIRCADYGWVASRRVMQSSEMRVSRCSDVR
nr:hypothetical protein [Brevibacterium iodinum]